MSESIGRLSQVGELVKFLDALRSAFAQCDAGISQQDIEILLQQTQRIRCSTIYGDFRCKTSHWSDCDSSAVGWY